MEPRSYQRSKHALRHYRMIKVIISAKWCESIKSATDDNVADPLTRCSPRANLSTIYSQWVLDTLVIGSRSSGRLLEICPRAIVMNYNSSICKSLFKLIKGISSLYCVVFNYICLLILNNLMKSLISITVWMQS